MASPAAPNCFVALWAPTDTSKTEESISPGLAAQQRARERALKRLRRLRERARNEIDRLLEFLDATDIDPDLEPSLGWTIAVARSYGNDQGIDDLEAEPEHDEDGADGEDGGDAEPSTGSLDGKGDQPRGRRSTRLGARPRRIRHRRCRRLA